MAEYRLIEKMKIDEIIILLEKLKGDCDILINNLKKEDALLELKNIGNLSPKEKIEIKPFQKDGPTLSSIIYDSVPLESFTAKQAYDIIKDRVHFKGNRPVDSIRSALRNDTKRFKKGPRGEYHKIR